MQKNMKNYQVLVGIRKSLVISELEPADVKNKNYYTSRGTISLIQQCISRKHLQ